MRKRQRVISEPLPPRRRPRTRPGLAAHEHTAEAGEHRDGRSCSGAYRVSTAASPRSRTSCACPWAMIAGGYPGVRLEGGIVDDMDRDHAGREPDEAGFAARAGRDPGREPSNRKALRRWVMVVVVTTTVTSRRRPDCRDRSTWKCAEGATSWWSPRTGLLISVLARRESGGGQPRGWGGRHDTSRARVRQVGSVLGELQPEARTARETNLSRRAGDFARRPLRTVRSPRPRRGSLPGRLASTSLRRRTLSRARRHLGTRRRRFHRVREAIGGLRLRLRAAEHAR